MGVAAQIAILLLTATLSATATEIQKYELPFGEQTRAYYFYRGKSAADGAPLVLLLHGSGQHGKYMIERWRRLADRNGLVLVAPGSRDRQYWNLDHDGPELMREVVFAAEKLANTDARRTFLFGYSGGARHALDIAALEPAFFAAVAVFAGALDPRLYPHLRLHEERLPVLMIGGADDAIIPPEESRETCDEMKRAGFSVEYRELPGRGHSYEEAEPLVNPLVWSFFRDKKMGRDRAFFDYDVRR
jgi:poly(3-hydroxybutyrate) depolymerase